MGYSLERWTGITITNDFQKVFDESNRRPNKICVDKGSELYENFLKSWLRDNNLEMYSIHNNWKAAVAERFIRNLKNKNYKYMTLISKKFDMYIDKLDDKVN